MMRMVAMEVVVKEIGRVVVLVVLVVMENFVRWW